MSLRASGTPITTATLSLIYKIYNVTHQPTRHSPLPSPHNIPAITIVISAITIQQKGISLSNSGHLRQVKMAT